jgi:hypothetical protein
MLVWIGHPAMGAAGTIGVPGVQNSKGDVLMAGFISGLPLNRYLT